MGLQPRTVTVRRVEVSDGVPLVREMEMAVDRVVPGDILVVNGYAGTGKTSALAAVVGTYVAHRSPCVLLAPTGRSAKVLSAYTGRPAYTVHKHIYRQKSHGDDGFGQFSLSPNKAKGTLYIVDEVSLIGIDAAAKESSTRSVRARETISSI